MTILETAQYVLDSIEHLGFVLDPESRLMTMQTVLKKGLEAPDKSLPADLFPVALQAFREFQMLAFIFEQINTLPLSEELRKKVKLILKDRPLPQSDAVNSPGRDNQTEFFVHALCSKAGFLSHIFLPTEHGSWGECV